MLRANLETEPISVILFQLHLLWSGESSYGRKNVNFTAILTFYTTGCLSGQLVKKKTDISVKIKGKDTIKMQ